MNKNIVGHGLLVFGLIIVSIALLPATALATQTRTISFSSLGESKPIKLRGVESSVKVQFGGRLDEVVRRARLDLHYSVSPSLIKEWSHLNVRLNDRLVQTITFADDDDDDAEADRVQAIDLPVRLFADYNALSFELIAHYAESCEFVGHSTLWGTINPDSALVLELEELPLAPRLELLPAPFFDPRDNRDLDITVVLADLSDESLRAAGMLASWFGALADYRSVHFELLRNELPQGHAIVLGEQAELFQQLDFQPGTEPSLAMYEHPRQPGQRLLLLHGGTNNDLSQAVYGLVYGRQLLSGQVSRIMQPIQAIPRRPYDAPAWMPTDKPVRFARLIDDPADLEARGNSPAPIELDLRLPPDLFPGFGNSALIKMNYRYTPPILKDNSRLSVLINERFTQAYRLLADEDGGGQRFYLPLFDRDFFAATSQTKVPAFQIGSRNRLSFAFNLDHHYIDPCRDMPSGSVYSSIDEDSTIDFSRFPRYIELPDLDAFASSGFPFTRHADLAETTVIIPDNPSTAELETYLYLMARFGRLTGATATLFELARYGQTPPKNRDLLLVGRNMSRLQADTPTPMLIEEQARVLDTALIRGRRRGEINALPSLSIQSDAPLALIAGFESPVSSGRSVVSVTGSSLDSLRWIVSGLEDPARNSKVRGNVALFTSDRVSSIEVGKTYALGNLSWGQRIWLWFSRHPTSLALLGIIAGLIFAALLFWLLRAIANRRLSA